MLSNSHNLSPVSYFGPSCGLLWPNATPFPPSGERRRTTPSWPSAANFQAWGGGRAQSLVPNAAREIERLHGPWTIQLLEERPDFLEHSCSGDPGHLPLAELARSPLTVLGGPKLQRLDELTHPQKLPQLQNLELKLRRSGSSAADRLDHWLCRYLPERRQRLLVYLQDPQNREWWSDLEGLIQVRDRQSLDFVESLRHHPHPRFERFIEWPVGYWNSDERLWRQALDLACQPDEWAARCLLRHGPPALQRRPFWS